MTKEELHVLRDMAEIVISVELILLAFKTHLRKFEKELKTQ